MLCESPHGGIASVPPEMAALRHERPFSGWRKQFPHHPSVHPTFQVGILAVRAFVDSQLVLPIAGSEGGVALAVRV